LALLTLRRDTTVAVGRYTDFDMSAGRITLTSLAAGALLLLGAPAQAFKPLVCDVSHAPEKWVIDGMRVTYVQVKGKRVTRTPGERLLQYRRIGLSDTWWTHPDGPPNVLTIKSHRKFTWSFSNGGNPLTGTCRPATRRNLIAPPTGRPPIIRASDRAPSAEAFEPLICDLPEASETWRVDGTGMTPIQGARHTRLEFAKKYPTIKHYDSWKYKDEKGSVVITDRRTIQLVNSSATPSVIRGTCRDAAARPAVSR
jgi:hypothetical protein